MNNISEMRLPDPRLKRDGPPRHYGWALFALAAAAFGIGTTEFGVMGLRPDVAKGLGATIPQAGGAVARSAPGGNLRRGGAGLPPATTQPGAGPAVCLW